MGGGGKALSSPSPSPSSSPPSTTSSSSSSSAAAAAAAPWPLSMVLGFGMRGLLFLLLAIASITLLLLLSTDFLAFSSSQLLVVSPSSSGMVSYGRPAEESLYGQESDSISDGEATGESWRPAGQSIEESSGPAGQNPDESVENLSSRSGDAPSDEPEDQYHSLREQIMRHDIMDKSRGGGGGGHHPLVPEPTNCDYYTGKWVRGANKPLYSGSSCKRWLSGMWACREMPGRPSFEYESYKWKPSGCELPTFQSRDFLSRMRNKVVAFVGDSIGRQQFQSLMCMLTGGDDEVPVEDVGRRYGLVKKKGELRAEGIAQRFVESNTTVIYYWSATLCEVEPLDKARKDTEYAMHLDRPAAFIQKHIAAMDVLVLNTGHHWNRGKMRANKWVMHAAGKPVGAQDRVMRDLGAARNFTMQKVAEWLDERLARQVATRRARVYMRSLSPRHFFDGDWDSGGRCDAGFVPVESKNISGRAVSDPGAESATFGTRIRLLNVTYISQFRDEAHISKYRPGQTGQDCLHWCLPGVPDVWNELLYAEILAEEDNAMLAERI